MLWKLLQAAAFFSSVHHLNLPCHVVGFFCPSLLTHIYIYLTKHQWKRYCTSYYFGIINANIPYEKSRNAMSESSNVLSCLLFLSSLPFLMLEVQSIHCKPIQALPVSSTLLRLNHLLYNQVVSSTRWRYSVMSVR